MAFLNPIASNWSRAEREKLNNNWTIIESYLSNLQGQINLLTGDVDVQKLVDQINDILNQGNVVIADLEAALQNASTVISNAQNATTEANNAAQEALDAVNDIQSMIDNFSFKGIYDNDTIYSKNNSVYHEGNSYIYTNNTPSKGNTPPIYPTVSNAYWQMTAAKGIDGTGAVSKVAGKSPELDGNVPLTAQDIGAASNNDFISVSRFGIFKDSTTIQNALDFAKSVGGAIIVIPAGTYMIMEVLKVPSNTKVLAEGNVIFKRMTNINAIMHNDADDVTGGYGASKNINVTGIVFDSNNIEFAENTTALAFGHCTGIVVENCEFMNCTTWHDLELNASSNVLIYNCRFPNYTGTSEMLQLDYAGTNGQFPWFGPFDNTHCKNIRIEGCIFRRNETEHNDSGGIYNIAAIGNHSFTAGAKIENVAVKDCLFENIPRGIDLGDTTNLKIVNNTFKNTRFAVIYEEHQNDCYSWLIKGNYYELSPILVTWIPIEGRFFYTKTNVPIKEFADIIISDNEIVGAYTNAIGISWTSNLLISGNIIKYAGRNGIYLYGGNNALISDNVVVQNNGVNEANRGDIVIGNNTSLSLGNSLLSNNVIDSLIIGSNVSNNTVINNHIKKSLVNNTPSGAFVHNNMVVNAWTP